MPRSHNLTQRTGYVLRRKSDGSYLLYDEVRKSKAGANQSLWNWVGYHVQPALQAEYGYTDDEAWSIDYAAKKYRRDRMSLTKINDELVNDYKMPPVTQQQLHEWGDMRQALHDEWDIVMVAVVH